MPDLDAVIEAVTADMFAAACGTPLAPSTVLGWRERLLAARDDYARAARVAKPTLDRERLARALHESDMMRRFNDYANRVPTMRPTPEHTLCVEWAAAIADAYEAEP